MRFFRVLLVGLFGAVVGFVAIVVYTIATAPPAPQTGVMVIALPRVPIALFAISSFVGCCWWQWRRERRRAGFR
jgi:hypothetical protein